MSLLDRILRWSADTIRTWQTARHLARNEKARNIGERILASMIPGAITYGWPSGWSQDRIEQVLHYKHWTFVGIRAIGNFVAGLTPNIGYVHSDSPPQSRMAKRHYAKQLLRDRRYQKTLHAIKPHEEIELVDFDHPLHQLFHHPNELDVAFDLIFELILFRKLTGNSYIWKVPNKIKLGGGASGIAELWVIPAHWVWPHIGKGHLIDFYEIRPWIGPGTLAFPRDEVIHLRDKNPMHKVDGNSPQWSGSEWIDAAESVDRSRFYQFKNGAFPYGAIELDEKWHDPDDHDMERIYAKFFARAQGESNYGRPIIMPPGATYKQLLINPMEMAYVESAEQLRDWVLSLLGVPKEIVGIQPSGNELSWYAPMVQFCSQTIKPELQYLGQVLTRDLAMLYDDKLRIWYDDPTPDNPVQVNQDITTDLAARAIAPNEVRALRGREPWPGGDDPITPVNESPMPLATGEGMADYLPTAQQIALDQGNTFVPNPHQGQQEEEPAPEDETDKPNDQPPVNRMAGFLRKELQLLEIPDLRQEQDGTCGPAALRAVCQYLGVGPETEQEYVDLLKMDPDEGTRVERMIRGAQSLGLDVHADTMETEDLANFTKGGAPVICPVQAKGTGKTEGHYVVVTGVADKSVFVWDPAQGHKRVGKKLWIERWHDRDDDGQEYHQYGMAMTKAKKAAPSKMDTWKK